MTPTVAPHQEFHALVSRVALAAIYAEVLAPQGDAMVRPSQAAGEYRLNDSSFADAVIKRYPDGPDGERWLLIGNDWDDFCPFQLAETPEAHLAAGAAGPGSPDWLGLHTTRDLYHLTMVDCPSIVTWYDAGRWHVSGARLDSIADPATDARTAFAPFDPERPWTDKHLAHICRPFGDDEATRRHVIARDILSAADPELCTEEQAHDLARRCWNAALDPAVAENTQAFSAHLRNLLHTVTARPVDEHHLDVALARLAALRGLMSPQTLSAAEGPGSIAAPADRTRDRVAANLTMIEELGAVAAAEAAAGAAEDERTVRLGWAGLLVQAPGRGWTLLTGLDPSRLVAAGHTPDHAPRYRSDHIRLFDREESTRYPAPDWLPRGLIEHATRCETTALAWTVEGLWRGAGRGDALQQPTFDVLRVARAHPRPKASWRPAPRREADSIRQAIDAFLAGNAVLAAGAPPAYPSVAPAEPYPQALERAGAEHRLRAAIEDWGCVSALGLVFIDLPPAPMPGAGQDR